MLELGTVASDFLLPDPNGKTYGLKDVRGPKGTLVMFICNHCPFVIHIQDRLVAVCNQLLAQGIGVIAINANDVAKYPDDSPEKMASLSQKLGMKFPYVFDESQKVAQAYQAACTPDFFLFDRQDRLVYRGQFDDARPSLPNAVSGRDLLDACHALLQGKIPDPNQKPSIGCNIKWK
jgi:peroxiredoxin